MLSITYFFGPMYQRDTDGQYPRPIRLAVGNGLQLHLWREFQERFKIGVIKEFYSTTEGCIGLRNENGHVGAVGRYSWILKVILVRSDGCINSPDTFL